MEEEEEEDVPDCMVALSPSSEWKVDGGSKIL
jgi:hypothetical protein